MNPELDTFLNETFAGVQQTSPTVGRVVVTPDFEASADPSDQGILAEELTELLRDQTPDPASLTSTDGFVAAIPNRYRLLSKYVRSITLYHDPPAEGPWIEVAPPGNWI